MQFYNGRLISIIGVVLLYAAYAIWGGQALAPAVTVVTLQGESVALSDLRGKVVLLNFWATDCPGCIQEMPQLVSTYQQYHAQGLETIAVAMRHDPPNYVLNYTAKNQLPFKVALDPIGEIARAFGDVKLTPTTIVIDKQGRMVMRILGQPDFVKLHQLIATKLQES